VFSLLSVMLYSGFTFGGSHNWDEVLAEAKKEGKVNWFQWYLVDALAEFIKPFEEEYGIDVVITQGKHTVNIDKAVAEMGRSKGDIDVLSLGFDKIPDLNMPGMFIKLSDELPKDSRTTNLAGVDAKDYAYAWWGNQSGFAYDPEKVDESKLPQTPEEIAQFWEANPGKFGFNYENGGSGPSFFQNVLRVMGSADFTSGESSPEKNF
jgi:putative spermidine/putrescine transport system substrate-binding protein